MQEFQWALDDIPEERRLMVKELVGQYFERNHMNHPIGRHVYLNLVQLADNVITNRNNHEDEWENPPAAAMNPQGEYPELTLEEADVQMQEFENNWRREWEILTEVEKESSEYDSRVPGLAQSYGHVSNFGMLLQHLLDNNVTRPNALKSIKEMFALPD